MIEHNNFKAMLSEELKELQKLNDQLSLQLDSAPEGTLHVMPKKGRADQYNLYSEGKRLYLPKKQNELVLALAQKNYNQQLQIVIRRRIKSAKALLAEYDRTSVEQIYKQIPDNRKKLITPIDLPDSLFLEQWYEQHPGQANPFPLQGSIVSERGELMRSKSEKMLSDLFLKLGIPYVYEPKLVISRQRIFYPDVLLLDLTQRKTYIFEHFGMLDNSEYAAAMHEKLNTYMASGYLPGDKLLFSTETKEQSLNVRVVEKLLQKYLIH